MQISGSPANQFVSLYVRCVVIAAACYSALWAAIAVDLSGWMASVAIVIAHRLTFPNVEWLGTIVFGIVGTIIGWALFGAMILIVW